MYVNWFNAFRENFCHAKVVSLKIVGKHFGRRRPKLTGAPQPTQ